MVFNSIDPKSPLLAGISYIIQKRRLDRAQNRYLSAIRALAVVRRLQLPTIQVNVAERHVNVATGTVRGDELRGPADDAATHDRAKSEGRD